MSRHSAKLFLILGWVIVDTVSRITLGLAACTLSTTSLSFGAYDVFSPAPLDSTGSVTYACDPKDKNISINLDRGGASTFNPRRMLKGGETLNYNLYLDAARTVIWGDGTGGTQNYFDKNPPPNQSVTVTIHGRVPPGQDVTPGSYSNTVTVSINF